MKYGYMRVSTDHQDTDLQERALLRAGVEMENIFSDILSGADTARPGLADAIAALGEGDELLVWRFDRMSRDLIHYLLTAKRIARKGATLRSITEPFDITTPQGWFVFSISGVMAENERMVISQRTKAGLAAAKARGVKLGAKPVLVGEKYTEVRDMLLRGVAGHRIAWKVGCSEATIYKTFPGGRKALLAAASAV